MRSRISIECANEGCPGPASLEWMPDGTWRCCCVICGLSTLGKMSCADAFYDWFFELRYIVSVHSELALEG